MFFGATGFAALFSLIIIFETMLFNYYTLISPLIFIIGLLIIAYINKLEKKKLIEKFPILFSEEIQ